MFYGVILLFSFSSFLGQTNSRSGWVSEIPPTRTHELSRSWKPEKFNLHARINICVLHALRLRGLESTCVPRHTGKPDLVASLITDFNSETLFFVLLFLLENIIRQSCSIVLNKPFRATLYQLYQLYSWFASKNNDSVNKENIWWKWAWGLFVHK